MKGILNNNLVKVSQQYLHPGGQVHKFHEPLMAGMYAELFEQLLLFDKVSISLNPMAGNAIGALLERFSLEDLVRALDSEALELVLPSVMSMTNAGPHGQGKTDPTKLVYQAPVAYGILQEPGGGEAQRVVADSLRYTNKFRAREQPAIIQLLASYIKRGSLTDGEHANELVMDAYNSNSLATIGLPYSGDAFAFDFPTRVKYQTIAGDIEDLLFVAENNYGLYETPVAYDIAKQSVGNIENAFHVKRSNDKILTDTALPNLRTLYSSGKASFKTALALRSSTDSQEFRRWIYTVSDPAEYRYVTRRYIEAIAKPIGFVETTPGKVVKGIVMQGLGDLMSGGAALMATSLGGPVAGAAAYLSANALLTTGLEVTKSLFLDKISGDIARGWTPNLFVRQVQTLAEGPK